MKTFIKKFAMFLLVLNFIAIPLSACSTVPDKEIEGVTFENTAFSYNAKEQSLLVTGDLPEGVTATYENNTHKDYGMYEATCTLSGSGYKTKTLSAIMTIRYDDKGHYDESAYAYRNQLSDDTAILTESEKAGTFSDGRTEVLYADGASMAIDGNIKGGLTKDFNSSVDDVDAYYLTSQQLLTIENVEAPYTGNVGVAVLSSKKIENKVAYLSLKPSCTKEEFLEADYLEFYMYLHAKNNQNNDGSEVTLSMVAGNVRIFNCDANAWVYVKVPLDIYKYSRSATITSYNNGAGVNSREEFYEYLSAGQPFLYTNATLKHLATEDMTYKMYFSDLKMKVETPDDGHARLRNNFAKLNEEQLLPDKQVKVLKNIFPRYYSNALNINDYVNYDGFDVVKMSIELNKWQTTNVNTLTNIMYVQVNPSKSLKQIAQYDALAVTMRVDTQNPNPLVAMLDYPTKYATDKNNVLARFSANKWITFEIPVELLLAMYPYMENTCVYEIPGNTYTWLNQVQELFYITYEYNDDGSLKYARDIYQAKTKLDGGTAKWTDVPCLGEELRPYKQGGWIQYPINVYIKSLKLIKKETE